MTGHVHRRSPVARAALVLFLLLGALLTAIGLTLNREASRTNEQRAAAQLTSSVQIAATHVQSVAVGLRGRSSSLVSAPDLQAAVAAGDTATLRRIARDRHVRIVAGGQTFGRLPAQPRLESNAILAAGDAVRAQVTVARAIDRSMLAEVRAATPLPVGAELLFIRRGRRVIDATTHITATVPVPGTGTRIVAFEPRSAVAAPSAVYRRRVLIAALLTFLVAAGVAVPLARPLTRRFGELSDQAERDPLTGLANRRLLDDRLEEELDRARRHGSHLAFVLVDIDDFKRVNDRYGHQVGDDVLQAVSAVLAGSVRELDLAGRYGGEEFALVLPGTPTEGACRVSEQIRGALADLMVKTPDGDTIRITASFGAADFPTCATRAELIELADRCVYEAKREGKDRVVGRELVRA